MSAHFVEGNNLTLPGIEPAKNDVACSFIRFIMESDALRFGEITTKEGRLSPYFFNAGLFNDGRSLTILSEFYAKRTFTALLQGLYFDMCFGPAYKGIQLVAALSIQMERAYQINFPFAYNRKEVKNHGEGGEIIGAPLRGRVLIVDDVISAGTSVREAVEIIEAAGAQPAGVLVALDRQERGSGALSAVQEIATTYKIPVFSIAMLSDIIQVLRDQLEDEQKDDYAQFVTGHYLEKILAYKAQYGVDS